MTAPALELTCKCGNRAILSFYGLDLCGHCALDSERGLILARYFWNKPKDEETLYSIFEGIRSACSEFKTGNGKRTGEELMLERVVKDIRRYVRRNAACDDPLDYLARLKSDVWDIAP